MEQMDLDELPPIEIFDTEIKFVNPPLDLVLAPHPRVSGVLFCARKCSANETSTLSSG